MCCKAAHFRGSEFCRQEGLFEIHHGWFSCVEHDKNEPCLQLLMRRCEAIHHVGGEWGRRAGSLPANSQGSLPSGQLEDLDQALLEEPVLNSWEILLLSKKFQMQLFPSSHCEFFRVQILLLSGFCNFSMGISKSRSNTLLRQTHANFAFILLFMKEYIFTSTHFIKSDEKIFTSDFILKLFESQKD